MAKYVGMVTDSNQVESKVNFPLVNNSAVVTPGISFVIETNVPNSSTNYTVAAPCALKILDVYAIKSAAGSGAGDLVQVKQGATALSDALDLHVADKAVVRAVSIDSTLSFAAGESIVIDPTSAANCVCALKLICLAV